MKFRLTFENVVGYLLGIYVLLLAFTHSEHAWMGFKLGRLEMPKKWAAADVCFRAGDVAYTIPGCPELMTTTMFYPLSRAWHTVKDNFSFCGLQPCGELVNATIGSLGYASLYIVGAGVVAVMAGMMMIQMSRISGLQTMYAEHRNGQRMLEEERAGRTPHEIVRPWPRLVEQPKWEEIEH